MYLCALHELEFQGRGREQRLQGQAAGAMPRQGGAALCSLHHLAHGLLQVLLVRDGDQVCFSAPSMTLLNNQTGPAASPACL